MKNKNYQFLNFLSNQTDFGSEKRNRECKAKKGKKKKKSQTVLQFPRFCLTPSRHLVSQPSSITFMSSSSFSSSTPKLIIHPNPARTRIYGIVCWVKYLVDSPENIWGCLDESMFIESIESMFVEFSSTSPSMADRRELQGSDLTTELRAVAGVRASDFNLHRCVGWRRCHR